MASLTRNNRFIGLNYFNTNPNMSVPPEYWLQRLYDFDSELVVFPSAQVPFGYVLARRARRTGGMNAQDPAFASAPPDTKFCITRHLLPVSLITRHSTASWSIDNILADLRNRDIWAAGGAEAFADRVDGQDDAAEKKLKADIRADMWNRSGDAYRSYKLRTGSAVAASGTVAQATRRDKGGVSPQP